jgi:hypothetical protein
MLSPEVICAEVRAALEHEPRINLHRHPIHLRCEDGILTVDGEVADIVAKKLALELAAAVPGVDGLVDRLRVAPPRPMGDGAVRDHVRDAFLQEHAFATFAVTIWDKGQVDIVRPASGTPFGVIELTVLDGVVTLDGAVPSLSHKRRAGGPACSPGGCRGAAMSSTAWRWSRPKRTPTMRSRMRCGWSRTMTRWSKQTRFACGHEIAL